VWECDKALLLRLNVTIARHAGVDNISFLARAINHPISAASGLHRGGRRLAFALRKRCLFVQWINRHTISACETTAV
jgi:hypothetical protein